jgi:hypothetical protein
LKYFFDIIRSGSKIPVTFETNSAGEGFFFWILRTQGIDEEHAAGVFEPTPV